MNLLLWGALLYRLGSQLSYTPIGGVILSDIFGKCKCFFKILKNDFRQA